MPLDNIDFNLLQRILDRINSVHNQVLAFNHRMMELSKKLDKPEVVEKVDDASPEARVLRDEEHKKKMNEIFEKRKIGRPVGSLVEKQQQYFDLVKSGKIKSPVAKTLDYYQITRDENNEWIMNRFQE